MSLPQQPRPERRKAGVRLANRRGPLDAEQRRQVYAARKYLPLDVQQALGLHLAFDVYFKDPLVAATFPGVGLDTGYLVPWEPGLADGPTSARFAVVDYDATTGKLAPPAAWDGRNDVFTGPAGEALNETSKHLPQFHQVSTWAILQNTLQQFEGPFGLGRRIDWGFEGNRLTVVPHAGYGENAFYDRASKSLQFYYFDHDGNRIHTCLSTDIVTHEFGHALLDGIRPYFLEAVLPETAAFHEFMGDLTALLMVFRNNRFRADLARRTGGNLADDALLPGLAQEFGRAVEGSDYLRTAANSKVMAEFGPEMEPHDASQVLTGAIFDILLKLLAEYRSRPGKQTSLADALFYTIQRLQIMAIQALDLLPPVEGTFRDYALAMLRSELVANPVDPDDYRPMMAEVFRARGILSQADVEALLRPQHVFSRMPLSVFHDVRDIGGSPAAAYRFLHDNRQALFIPPNADVLVAGLATAQKLGREGRRLPRQVNLQYVWREEIVLVGERFGRFAGQATAMLCGATLVLDENGNVVVWTRKPGSESSGSGKSAAQEALEGAARRGRFVDAVAAHVAAGTLAEFPSSAAGLLAQAVPLLAVSEAAEGLRFTLTPHLSSGRAHGHRSGGVEWQPSS